MGRTSEMQEGFNGSRENRPGTVAPIEFHPFRPTSVLNPVASSGTGMSAGDRERRLMGQNKSTNGSSATTAQQTNMIKYPFMQLGG